VAGRSARTRDQIARHHRGQAQRVVEPYHGSSRSTEGANGRPYDYHNPGENVRGRAQPSLRDLNRYGTNTDGLDPGTPPHLYTSWNRYQKNKTDELKKWEDGGQVGKKPSTPLPWDK
jgi:hypothetical protein